ncbi:MAG TPA: isoaspartyl peptidase/L-asparaginase [Verrucomicrobiae bacterium]|nr:isoaspartyl peptidase/L-asparaginase [Verrucomicrobiae bacterium]
MSNLIRLALHGGAGDAAGGADHSAHRAALEDIARDMLAFLRQGASAVDAVERAVVRLEECPLFNAGVGAVLNRDGAPELDASIMRGADRACGAVTCVSRVKSPVQLARAVMERSPHVMLMGTGAEALARELGLPEVTPDYFVTEERFRQLKEAHRRGVIALDHDSAFGTVGAVARDKDGHLAAATSTGGLTNKHPGRIGDTPIIGAGTFADDSSCALSCTGTGESFIKAGFCFQVHARMAYSNFSLEQACAEALASVKHYQGRGGCIAIDRAGNVSLPFNSRVMYRASANADGQVRVGVEP